MDQNGDVVNFVQLTSGKRFYENCRTTVCRYRASRFSILESRLLLRRKDEMKLTSKDANKLLKQLSSELESLKTKEANGMTFVAATIEDPEKVRPDYNYGNMQNMISQIERKIIRIKHAINRFNIETKVPGFDMSIDEMLVYIPQLYERRQKLSRMKDLPKMTRSLQHGSNIIDYTYINFDSDTVAEDFKNVEAELARAQIALDKVNISETFEVEI